ncbi:MAG TPA: hypothetical protein VFU77_05705 [Steroidobacteraceae bacterium]|nr:hypothetical protein [Steroidobacteraceae bacterium]
MQRLIVPLTSLIAAIVILVSGPPRAEAQARPTPVREVQPPGSEPYSTLFSITLSSGSGTNGFSPDAVPANRRLVIEFVSVRVVISPPEKPRFALQDSIGGTSHPYILPLALASTGTFGEEYRATQLVKLYHDGNGANGPGADCAREQNSFNTMTCTVVISGYLIPK